MPRERFYVELAPGYVRLRHQLGYRTLYGRRRLGVIETLVVQAMEEADEPLEPVQVGLSPDDPDYDPGLEAAAEKAEQEAAEMEYLSSLARLGPEAIEEYFEGKRFEAANQAAAERLGRGAKGMSERSRREMWRWVLSLPFEMLGERPLWITLTYPGDWRRWVPDGPSLERHRRAFGEAWYRGFGERPVGFWAKEFQLAEGRPHLHLLMKGADSMPDADYRGFQALTRLGNHNVRNHGKHDGRW
jgi:PAS domain-containing protein